MPRFESLTGSSSRSMLRKAHMVAMAIFGAGTLLLSNAQSGGGQVDSSTADLAAQVVAPANSPTLNSTYGITGNDTANWTTYLQSRLDRPYEAIGTLSFPAGFTWVKDSIKVPPKTTLEWQINNGWVGTQPSTGTLVQAVRWKQTPLITVNFGVVDGTVDFTGTGDGFRIIPYQDRLYVVNHHSYRGGNYFHCRIAKTGGVCPGFTTGGLTFPLGAVGTPLYRDTSGNAPTATNHAPMEALNRETGELFVGVYGNWFNGNPPFGASGTNPNAYIVCVNLNTLQTCGQWNLGYSAIKLYHSIANYEYFELPDGTKKYYVQKTDGNLYCINLTTKQLCANTPVKYNGGVPTANMMSAQLGEKMFFASNTTMWCHDVRTEAACAGWSANGKSNGSSGGLFPIVTNKGAARGVCDTTGNICYDIAGNSMSISTNARNFINTNSFASRWTWGSGTTYSTNAGAIKKSKVYFAPNSGYGVSCFDFATDSACPGYPMKTDKYTQGYSNLFDPTRPNCILHLGNNAIGLLFDADTGGPCTDGTGADQPKLMDVRPADYYLCDNTKANVSGWDQVRLSQSLPWNEAGGLKSVKVTLQDGNGDDISSNPVRYFTPGQYSLDISDVSYTQYPRLKVTVQMTGNGGLGSKQDFGMDVTWKGDPIQFCMRATGPSSFPVAMNCGAESALNVTLAKFENADGVFDKVLTASHRFDADTPRSGYALTSMASSYRALTTDIATSGERRTQVGQGRWEMTNFSGDLWMFDLDAAQAIKASSLQTASSKVSASNYLNRRMFTAKPDGSNVLGSMQITGLQLGNLSAQQSAALNLSLTGALDNRASDRIAFLRGANNVAGARLRSSVFGPVINSGPVLMDPHPSVGYSEALFPGFMKYRNDAAKTKKDDDPMVIWGGNDGALHGFGLVNGALEERWAFVPDLMLRNGHAQRYTDTSLGEIQRENYFVDNVPMLAHADLSGKAGTAWTQVAVMTYGKGARGITALDLGPNGDIPNGRGVLFEYTNQSDPDLNDLGKIISQPVISEVTGSNQIVRVNDNGTPRWAVIVGNGVDSSVGPSSGTGRPVLYVFFLDKQAPRWRKLALSHQDDALIAQDNGLSSPRLVDTNGDGTIDLAYAGDMKGNLWRIDLTDVKSMSFSRLFRTDANQPILGAPVVVRNTRDNTCTSTRACLQVTFGTGQYFSAVEKLSSALDGHQYLYSVLDKGTGVQVLGSELATNSQTIQTGTQTQNGITQSINYRVVKAEDLGNYGSKRGWRLPLGKSEHLIAGPKLLPTGEVTYSAVSPARADGNVCRAEFTWLMNLSAVSGAPTAPSYDSNGDGSINSKDGFTQDGKSVPAAGFAVAGAQFGGPVILLDSSSGANTMSLLMPGMGQSQAQSGQWGGKDGNGVANSRLLKRGDNKNLGRMTWREVF